MKCKILVAHPGRHHVYNLVLGCLRATSDVKFITPFYLVGFAKFLALFPGSLGQKAKGYCNSRIPESVILSSATWQIEKLICMMFGSLFYEKLFDFHVSLLLRFNIIRPSIFLSLQDYMPRSVACAKSKGITIWSDQIINQSDSTHERIRKHEENFLKRDHVLRVDNLNIAIVQSADAITAPSRYCLSAFQDFVNPSTKLGLIPYGAEASQFRLNPKRQRVDHDFVIVARANSVRKGGHILLDALHICANDLIAIDSSRKIVFKILGKYDEYIAQYRRNFNFPDGIIIEDKNYPFLEVHKLYESARIFVMPSLSEGSSLACLEAMHAGLPLIYTDYCGIDEVDDFNIGIKIEDDALSLASALVCLVGNLSLCEELGENARNFSKNLTRANYEKSISRFALELIE